MPSKIKKLIPKKVFIKCLKYRKYFLAQYRINKVKAKCAKEGVRYVDVDTALNGELGQKFCKMMTSIGESRDKAEIKLTPTSSSEMRNGT